MKIRLIICLAMVAVLAGFVGAGFEVQNLPCDYSRDWGTENVQIGSSYWAEISFVSSVNATDVQAEFWIGGIEGHDVRAVSDVFSVSAGRKYRKTTVLSLPSDMEEGEYLVRYALSTRDGTETECHERIYASAERHSLNLKDAFFSPRVVRAGTAARFIVLIENTGQKLQESVRVSVKVGSLGIERHFYIDEIRPGEVYRASSYVELPACEEGLFRAQASLLYDESREVTEYFPLQLGDNCPLSEEDAGYAAETVVFVSDIPSSLSKPADEEIAQKSYSWLIPLCVAFVMLSWFLGFYLIIRLG